METIWRPGESTTFELELFAMLHAYQNQLDAAGTDSQMSIAHRATEEAEQYEAFVGGRHIEIQANRAIFRSPQTTAVVRLGNIGLMGTLEESYVSFESSPCTLGIILDADVAYPLANPSDKNWHGERSFVPIAAVNLAILK